MNRRDFLKTLAVIGASIAHVPAWAFGDDDVFTIGVLDYGGPSYNPRPTALRRLLMEVEMTTSVLVAEDPIEVDPTLADVFSTPLIVIAGDRDIEPWSEATREALRTFINAGGMLVVDSSEGRVGDFYDAIVREMAEILPSGAFAPLDDQHVIFKSFYLVHGGVGRVVVSDTLEGITHDERTAVVFSHNDLMGAWERDSFGHNTFECYPGGERQRTLAYRLGVNLVMYALCLDYKEDQVHIPFILGRRQWRVE